VRDFPVVPEKGGNLPYKGNVQHTTVGKGMFPEEINHRRVRVVSETNVNETFQDGRWHHAGLPLLFSIDVGNATDLGTPNMMIRTIKRCQLVLNNLEPVVP
jgi:hypothetical protein